jgi:transcription elongation factor SPT6
MARKVNEMTNDERYQSGSKSDTGTQSIVVVKLTLADKWLQTYTEANPKRSMYAFCINPKYPGYFHLCFKAGRDAPLGDWSVKVVPQAFELRRSQYPNMQALKNGFKTMIANANTRM